MSQRSRTARVSLALVCLLSASALASCSPGDAEADPSPTPTSVKPSSPTATPTPTTDPEVAAAQAAILDAYRGFWAAQTTALGDPVAEPPAELAVHAVDKAFAGVGEALFEYRRQGIVMVGAPTLDPVVDTVDRATSTAHVTDCVDSSDWTPIFRDTGESAAAENQSPRLVVEAWAIVYDGRWVIRETLIHRDRPC
ncbi:hypothetical protein [Cellulomonas cellasea]|uniref:DUF3828 domain-containing protein n=1 Tax=Cellulomonas cellasea TaxID=43670 RepID=A0A4Y3KYU4_9CELL|nr:hypothetical protein [Cellulomonas cellasea]GEA89057.1 hypothetical protein CCE01nite_30060 [Cellulomonas cellasea]